MRRSPYHGHRFPPAIIRHAVWLYLRFTLSLRDIEDLLAERGLCGFRFKPDTHSEMKPDGVPI